MRLLAPQTSRAVAAALPNESRIYRENAKQFLRDNPDMAGEIETAIRANAGLVAEEMLTGENVEDDDGIAAEAGSGLIPRVFGERDCAFPGRWPRWSDRGGHPG